MSIEKLAGWLADHAPHLRDRLADGASDAALDQAERILSERLGRPIALPPALRRTLAASDGERDRLVPDLTFLSVSEALAVQAEIDRACWPFAQREDARKWCCVDLETGRVLDVEPSSSDELCDDIDAFYADLLDELEHGELVVGEDGLRDAGSPAAAIELDAATEAERVADIERWLAKYRSAGFTLEVDAEQCARRDPFDAELEVASAFLARSVVFEPAESFEEKRDDGARMRAALQGAGIAMQGADPIPAIVDRYRSAASMRGVPEAAYHSVDMTVVAHGDRAVRLAGDPRRFARVLSGALAARPRWILLHKRDRLALEMAGIATFAPPMGTAAVLTLLSIPVALLVLVLIVLSMTESQPKLLIVAAITWALWWILRRILTKRLQAPLQTRGGPA